MSQNFSAASERTPIRTEAAATLSLAYLLPIGLIATLGGLLFGYDTGVISGAIEPLAQHFQLTEAMKGWASGSVLLGCAGGVLAIGPFSDRVGRKGALMAASFIFLLSAVGSAVPNTFALFVAARILAGFGIGMASITTPMYLAEIAPAAVRGRLVAANQIAIVGGIVLTSLINYFLAQAHHGLSVSADQQWLAEIGWRWMFASGGVPALVFFVLIFWIPESPRWLVEHKRIDQARAILRRIGGAGYADAELQSMKGDAPAAPPPWRILFSDRYRKPLVIGIALAVLQQVTGINVFLYFGATIFRHLSDATGLDAGLLQQIVINGACMASTLIAIGTIDRWGRKPLMIVGSLGMGVSLLGMGLCAEWAPGAESTIGIMLAFTIVYIACFGLSVGPVTWVILSEIFPTAVRGRALGTATVFLWLADYVVTQTFPILDAPGSRSAVHFHHALPFYIYAIFCGILVVMMKFKVPETRGLRLEEIERDWERGR